MRQIEPIPWQVGIDHAGRLKASKHGRKYILVAIDMFSGYPAAVPVASLHAGTTARALMAIFSIFGWPRTLISDRGTSFRNQVFKQLCKLAGVKHRFTIVRILKLTGQRNA